jgi:hydrogenase nickel incorporation protein HypA/HybF
MHEMSIVEPLLTAVRQELHAYPDATVKTVTLRVGALRRVVPEIMATCFKAATRDTNLAGSQLKVEEITAKAHCRSCDEEFPVEDNWFQCPHCGTSDGELLTGNELELIGLELGCQYVS